MNNEHAYDTRPEQIEHSASAAPISKASHHMEINPWLLMFGLLVVTPTCIYLSLLVLAATGLVMP